jgi:hypothetical protein
MSGILVSMQYDSLLFNCEMGILVSCPDKYIKTGGRMMTVRKNVL